eukprot:SAG25_NODE_112_length_14924_cov_13.606476_7_plen_955_part_00
MDQRALGATVVTLAGVGVGYKDGASKTARFNGPLCVAVDTEGGVLVTDVENHCIRYLSPDGKAVTTIAGNGKAGYQDGAALQAQFNFPVSVALDAQGGAVVADQHNCCLRYITPDKATVITIAGSRRPGHEDGAAAQAQFHSPMSVAMDAGGGIVIADYHNHCIRYLSPDKKTVSTLAGDGRPGYTDGAVTNARFRQPTGVAVGAEGGIVVADCENHRIRYISPDAKTVTTLAGNGKQGSNNGAAASAQFAFPRNVVVDAEGGILVAGFRDHQIRYLAPGGWKFVSTLAGDRMHGFDDGAAETARFDNPSSVALDARGGVVVADCANHSIRSISGLGRSDTLLHTLARDHAVTVERLKETNDEMGPEAWTVAGIYGRTPMHVLMANTSLSTRLVRQAIKDAPAEAWGIADQNGDTPLHRLMDNRSLTTELLQETSKVVKGWAWTVMDEEAATPLHLLAKNKALTIEILREVVKVVDAEAWIAWDSDWCTPLHWLVENLHPEMIRELGTALTAETWAVKDKDGNTPLFHLMRNKSLTVEALSAACECLPPERWADKDDHGQIPLSLITASHKVLVAAGGAALAAAFQRSPVQMLQVKVGSATLVEWLSSRQVPPLACREVHLWALGYGKLKPNQSRECYYDVIGVKVHGSETCLVFLAIDIRTNARVAMKFMANRDQWEREKAMRLTAAGEKLDSSHVLDILDDFELDSEAVAFCARHQHLKGQAKPKAVELRSLKQELHCVLSMTTMELECQLKKYDVNGDGSMNHHEFQTALQTLFPRITDAQVKALLAVLDDSHSGDIDYKDFAQLFGRYAYTYLITMPAAIMDLTYKLSHDHVAGNDLECVIVIMRQVSAHLEYMHETLGRIHGDLKPRNIVQIVVDGEELWILIDLDASCQLGALAGQKITSSAFFPPEMARRELDNGQGKAEIVLATRQFVVLRSLTLTGKPLLQLWYP